MNSDSWQRELSRAITKPVDLLAALGLDPALLSGMRAANETFGLRVTHEVPGAASEVPSLRLAAR